jgi:hypothetical protein
MRVGRSPEPIFQTLIKQMLDGFIKVSDWHCDSQLAKARRSNQNQQRAFGGPIRSEIGKTLVNQLLARQRRFIQSHAFASFMNVSTICSHHWFQRDRHLT